MLYFGNPSTAEIRAEMERGGRLGCIMTPAQGNTRPPRSIWICDNGCFGKGYPGDNGYVEWLKVQRARYRDRPPVFATAPDVVGDAWTSMQRSYPWLSRLRSLGYRSALVAQDGLQRIRIPWDEFDALFIGGSTDWKLSGYAAEISAEAKQRGKWVHMGRVNTRKRIRYAYNIGCHSADGTTLAMFPKTFSPIMRWLNEIHAIPPMRQQ